MHLVNCLAKFTKNKFLEFSMEAVELLVLCAKHLGDPEKGVIDYYVKNHS